MADTLRITPDVVVLGTGRLLGANEVDNPTLEKMVSNYDASSGDFSAWVERVTHIRTRHFCGPGETTATIGIAAARQALEGSGVDPEHVDLVIVCSFTARTLFPGDAVDMARSINSHCGAFSVAAACAGSVYGLAMAFGMVKSGLHRNVMVIGVEQLSKATNFQDPLTAILFADGAGAVLIGRPPKPEPGTGFIDRVVLKHDYAPGTIMMENANVALEERMQKAVPNPGGDAFVRRQFLSMGGGPRVLRNAVNAMSETVVELLGFTMDDLKADHPGLRELLNQVFLVPHQANGRIVDGLQEKLGIPEEQVYRTVYFTGNMSAATNVVTLDYAMREGNLMRRERPDGPAEIKPCGRRLKKGDLVVVTTIGGGYLYGAVGFRL